MQIQSELHRNSAQRVQLLIDQGVIVQDGTWQAQQLPPSC